MHIIRNIYSNKRALSINSKFSKLLYTTATSADAPQPVQIHNLTANPKIDALGDQISSLTLLETAQLIDSLKIKLNITDVQLASSAQPQAQNIQADTEQEAKVEKNIFNVKLEKFEAASKAKIIREIKNIKSGMTLVEAKKFVESSPQIVMEQCAKDEAEKIKKSLEALGATIVLE